MAPSKMALKSNNVRKVVKQMLNAQLEHKVLSNATGVIDWTTAGVVSLISTDVAQGDDLNQRSGSQLILEKVKLVMTSTAVAGSTSTLRVILFIDHINNGSVPAITDILTAATPTDAYALPAQSVGRFKILGDWFMLTSVNTGNAGFGALSGLPAVVSKEQTWKLKDRVQYNAATNVAGANGKGALFMLFVDTGANCTYRVAMNLTYSDA